MTVTPKQAERETSQTQQAVHKMANNQSVDNQAALKGHHQFVKVSNFFHINR